MGRILWSSGEKFLEFFPVHFGKIYKIAAPLPTAALVTDIGNDLLYGVPVEQLLEWVEGCLDRLADVGAKTIVTQLPVDSVEPSREADFDSSARCFFRNARSRWPTRSVLGRAINERLVRDRRYSEKSR